MKKGFTLIEVLAVVTIIGLIFILIIPKITTSLKNKKSDVDATTNNLIITAAKNYIADNKTKFDKVDNNTYCLPLTTLIKKDYLDSPVKNVTDDLDITNSKSVKIIYNKGFKYEIVDKKECSVVANKKIESKRLINYLLSNINGKQVTNYMDGNIHEMYTFDHPATDQTTNLTDYRYIGDDPYNYVNFNNEIWRIIGVFTVEDENGNFEERIKIMKFDYNREFKVWSDTNDDISWENSNLKQYLNTTFYNSIDDTYKKMIKATKFYTAGDIDYYSIDKMYSAERGLKTVKVDGVATKNNWIGRIGVMYPSDYIYTFALGVNDICYNTPKKCRSNDGGIPEKSWMFTSQYTYFITACTYSSGYIFAMMNEGRVNAYGSRTGSYYGYPVVYLDSNIKFTHGNGSEDDPYVLVID